MIRSCERADVPSVVAIFNHYVKHDICTFQLSELSDQQMLAKINEDLRDYPFLVMEKNQEIVGFAYGSRWRNKQAYDGSVEATIYIKNALTSKGFGYLLYSKLMDEFTHRGFHLVVACITLPNPGSIVLHERLGFEKVGIFTEAGKKFGCWHDVGFWQKKLN